MFLTGGQSSLFELDEDDEVGDGHGDAAGERAPVHGEQPVPGHRLQVLDVPQQLPRGLLADTLLHILRSSPQVPQAGVEIVDLEEEELQQSGKDQTENKESKHHDQQRNLFSRFRSNDESCGQKSSAYKDYLPAMRQNKRQSDKYVCLNCYIPYPKEAIANIIKFIDF